MPGAGVPLGGGGRGGGGDPALLHLPGLDTSLALLAPDPGLATVPVEAVAEEALAPLTAAALGRTACTGQSAQKGGKLLRLTSQV